MLMINQSSGFSGYVMYKVTVNNVFYGRFLGGLQFGNTNFKSRLSYGGGGGGGGGSAFHYAGGRGGNGGGLVYLQLTELTLKGTINANGKIICHK